MTDKEKEISETEKNFREKAVPFLKKVQESKEAKEIARENGIHIGNTIWHDILLAFFILTIISGIFVFLYLTYSGSFKDEISLVCPNITIPDCVCDLSCPENADCICDVICPAFPDSIDVIIKNLTE